MEGVTPSCQLHVSYREKSTWGSNSTDGLAATRSNRSFVSIVTRSPPFSNGPGAPVLAPRTPTEAPRARQSRARGGGPAADDPDERRERGEDGHGATTVAHRSFLRCPLLPHAEPAIQPTSPVAMQGRDQCDRPRRPPAEGGPERRGPSARWTRHEPRPRRRGAGAPCERLARFRDRGGDAASATGANGASNVLKKRAFDRRARGGSGS